MNRTAPLRALALAAALVLGASALSGCSTNPATGQQAFTGFMSPADEIKVGREQDPLVKREFGGEIDDPKIKAYVTALGRRLAKTSELPDLEFNFSVLNSDIVNAFALPGGYVYVTRGLLALASTEAELAGVLGHEIGHVTARHTAQRYSRAVASSAAATVGAIAASIFLGQAAGEAVGGLAQYGLGAWLAGYSRDQEFEADLLGVRYLGRTGYDVDAMADFLAKLQAESRLQAELAGRPEAADQFNIMQSHPRTTERVREATEQAEAAGGRARDGRAGRDEYLDTIDGMEYGGDAENGFVRNRTFLHPKLRLQFDVPPGFTIFNGERSVTARGPNGAQIVFDRDPRREAQGMAMTRYIPALWARNASLSRVERIEVNGMEGATAGTRLQTRAGAVDVQLVAIRFDPGTVYRFLFAAPAGRFAEVQDGYRRTTYSFRQISTMEAAQAKPLRLRVVRVRSGDTTESLARRMAFDTAQVRRFQVLNGLQPGQQPRVGDRVKLIDD